VCSGGTAPATSSPGIPRGATWNAAVSIDTRALTRSRARARHLCVAVDSSGDVVTGNPTSGTWGAATSIDARLRSTPSAVRGQMCVALDVTGKVMLSNGTSGRAHRASTAQRSPQRPARARRSVWPPTTRGLPHLRRLRRHRPAHVGRSGSLPLVMSGRHQRLHLRPER